MADAGLADRIKAAVDTVRQAYQTLISLHNGDEAAALRALQGTQNSANVVLSGQKPVAPVAPSAQQVLSGHK